MNYFEQLKGLIAEAKQGIQFKRISKTFNILLIIGLIPQIIATFLSVAIYSITLFVYKAISCPLEYIHSFVKKEGS